MKAAFLTGLQQVELLEIPEPVLKDALDVKIRVEAVGICGSDMHYHRSGRIGAQQVHYPQSVGHECAGTVVEPGPGCERIQVGQRVAVEPALSCGHCDQCHAQRPHTCRNLRFMGCPDQAPGTLAERIVVPEIACHPVPQDMSAALAAVMEPFSIGVYAANLGQIQPGMSVGILGTGPIGLCILLALQIYPSLTLYATDLYQERLTMAERFGAHWTGHPTRLDMVSSILEHEPKGLDVVYECAGEQDTLDQAVELLKPGGRLVLVGIPESPRIHFNIDLLRRKELVLQNVRRQNGCMDEAIHRAQEGHVLLNPLITHTFNLSQVQSAFDLVAHYRDGVIKAVIHLP